MDALQQAILLNRYAKRDVRSTPKIGDTVLVITDKNTSFQELGTVVSVSDSDVTVQLADSLYTTTSEFVDILVETTPADIWDRVANAVAEVEPENESYWSTQFRRILDDWKFVPGGRILAGMGASENLTMYNCFVLPNPKDSRQGIMDSLAAMTDIMARGGGVGINISSLRPRNAIVEKVNGRSSGAVSWASLFSFTTGLIEQGGKRRGAGIQILEDWHPDIIEFINIKRTSGKMTNSNISVGISDAFMHAVENDLEWVLRFPDTTYPNYDELWDGDLKQWESQGFPVIEYQRLKARDMWNMIIESAWACAEPGLWFIDRANHYSNGYYFSRLVSTNPCVTGDTLVSTEFGYTPAKDLKVGMKIQTPKGLKPIEKVYNNGVQKIYRANFSDGGYLDATNDHKLKTIRNKKYEWVAFKDLIEGDKVLITSGENFGNQITLPEEVILYGAKNDLNLPLYYNRDIGLIIGTIIGDGTFRKNKSRNSYSYDCRVAFGLKEESWENAFYSVLDSIGFRHQTNTYSKEIVYESGNVTHSSKRMASSMIGSFLARINFPFNVKAPYKTIPSDMLSMDREFLAGVVDGLFSTDGSVSLSSDSPLLRLSSASKKLLDQVRLILLQFGIQSRIYYSKRNAEYEYDGRNMYGTGDKYDLVIMNEGIARFYEQIGLSNPDKQALLKIVADEYYFIGGTWTATVTSIEDTGREEEVFDVYEPETLTWITNGYTSFDCGEIGLTGWAVCNLGAINLSKFWDNGVLWDELGETVELAVRFLDNVVDRTPYFLSENERVQKDERRLGLNTMGLADLFIKAGIRYGSQESLDFIDELYTFIRDRAYQTSAELAKEKGNFPKYDRDKVAESNFIKTLPEWLQNEIYEKGLRNVAIMTQAPNGSTGSMVGVSTGIEPHFAFSYHRKSRLGEFEQHAEIVREWKEANPDQPLPSYFVTAMDLTPEEHVLVMAQIQKYVDQSISKSCNLPNSYTVEDTGKIYQLMYKLGCKGGTVYRDGSRDEQVLNLKKEEPTKTEFKAEKRPDILPGKTLSVKTSFGTVYVTINEIQPNQPFEVFVSVGKGGSDLEADSEGLGRLASLVLRSTPDKKQALTEIINQLEGIGGANPYGMGKKRILSLPDAVAHCLKKYMGKIEESITVETPNKSSGSGLDLCPSCHNMTLLREDGCKKCLNCEYSAC